MGNVISMHQEELEEKKTAILKAALFNSQHLSTANGCLMDVGFKHDKMKGLLFFMTQFKMDCQLDDDDLRWALTVLEDLVIEAKNRLDDYDRHYRQFLLETGLINPSTQDQEGGD